MQVSDEMVKVAARAAAKANGDDYDQIPADKSEWIENRGQFGGRYRDVNEPYKTDYEEMAEAALTAALALSGWRTIDSAPKDGRYIIAARFGKDQDLKWVSHSRWMTAEEAAENEGGEPEDFYAGWTDGEDEDDYCYPTHWKPLDAPPATAGKEG